jgi:hypothetical protein
MFFDTFQLCDSAGEIQKNKAYEKAETAQGEHQITSIKHGGAAHHSNQNAEYKSEKANRDEGVNENTANSAHSFLPPNDKDVRGYGGFLKAAAHSIELIQLHHLLAAV